VNIPWSRPRPASMNCFSPVSFYSSCLIELTEQIIYHGASISLTRYLFYSVAASREVIEEQATLCDFVQIPLICFFLYFSGTRTILVLSSSDPLMNNTNLERQVSPSSRSVSQVPGKDFPAIQSNSLDCLRISGYKIYCLVAPFNVLLALNFEDNSFDRPQ